MQLLDRTTSQVVEVPDDQLQGAFQTGKYAFIKGDDYAFKDPTSGESKVHDADSAAQALAAGQQIDPSANTDAMRLKEKYEGQTSQVGEGARSFLNTLTLGGADAAALAAAEALGGKQNRRELAEKMEASEELNQAGHYAGMAAGFVLPAVLTGGASVAVEGAEAISGAAKLGKVGSALAKVGKVAAAPFEVLSGVGGIGEKATAALVGEASEHVLARMIQKGVTKGAGMAIEGGLLSVADQLHEDALGDKELNGEKVAAAFGHGAFYGSMLGAAGGAGLTGLSSGAKWAIEHASPAAAKAAEEMAIKSLSYGGFAPTKLTKRLETIEGGVRGVGRELLDKGLVRMGETVETAAPRIRAAADDAGSGLTEGLSKLGSQFEGPKTETILKSVGDRMESEFGTLRRTNSGAFSKVDDIMSDFATRFPEGKTDMVGLRDFRRLVDQEINFNPPPVGAKVNPVQEALKVVRGTIEQELEKSIDVAGEKLSGDALKEYKALKLTYRRLATAADMAEDAVTRTTKNQSASVSEKMLSGLGIVHAVASGHPAAAVAGFAASMAHHAIAARGASAGAVALDKISALTAIRRTVENVDSRMNEGVAGFLEKKTPTREPLVFKSSKARDEAYDASVSRVRVASSSPDRAAGAIEKTLGATITHAPKIAAKASQVAARAAVFLAAKVPPTPPSKTITPQFETPEKPSPGEQEKFLRYVRAADDPLSVIDDMQHGRLTMQGVETLREVYPQLYEELQKTAIEKCADAKHPLDYNQKIQLGLLLDVPTDATLEPAFMRRMQQMHQENSGSEGGPGGGALKGPPKRPLTDTAHATALGTQRSDK